MKIRFVHLLRPSSARASIWPEMIKVIAARVAMAISATTGSIRLPTITLAMAMMALAAQSAIAEEGIAAAPAPSIGAATLGRAAPSSTGTFYDRINPGLVGGLGGAGIGVLGGLIGAVGGFCAPRGKAKGLVLALFAIQIGAGFVLIGLGIGATVVGAPGMVSYGLLMPGGLALLLGITLFPVMLMRYRQAEMRRIEAEAFRTS